MTITTQLEPNLNGGNAPLLIGLCNRCGKEILPVEYERLLMLKAIKGAYVSRGQLQWEHNESTDYYFLCKKCADDFIKWIINKGDDTV